MHAWFALSHWEWRALKSILDQWNLRAEGDLSSIFPSISIFHLFCAPRGWLYGLHSQISLPNGSHWQETAWRKKSDFGCWFPWIPHCWATVAPSFGRGYIALNPLHQVSCLGLVFGSACLFRFGDSDSLLLLLTPGAYAIPMPFLNGCKSFFFNFFSAIQLSGTICSLWYSDIEVAWCSIPLHPKFSAVRSSH